MAKKLNSTVHVHLTDGNGNIRETVVVGPNDKLSADVRKALANNPRVWDEVDDGEDEQPARPGPSETADAGHPAEAAVAAGQAQRDAEASGSDEDRAAAEKAAAEAVAKAAEQASGGGGEEPAPRSTRARRSGSHS
jgi:hypothetical protein